MRRILKYIFGATADDKNGGLQADLLAEHEQVRAESDALVATLKLHRETYTRHWDNTRPTLAL